MYLLLYCDDLYVFVYECTMICTVMVLDLFVCICACKCHRTGMICVHLYVYLCAMIWTVALLDTRTYACVYIICIIP